MTHRKVRCTAIGRDEFVGLVRRHDEQMRGLAWNLLRDRDAMDDALQEAYLKAYRSLDGFRGDASFSTWLHQIVYRACIDQLRRRKPQVAIDDDAVWTVDARTDVAAGVEARVTVDAALASLDPETAAALVLVDRDGHSYETAGRVLGIPAGTVASRLHRGRQRVRIALEASDTENGDLR